MRLTDGLRVFLIPAWSAQGLAREDLSCLMESVDGQNKPRGVGAFGKEVDHMVRAGFPLLILCLLAT